MGRKVEEMLVVLLMLVPCVVYAQTSEDATVEAMAQSVPVEPDARVNADSVGPECVLMSTSCDPESVILSEYPQWAHEEGYFFGSDFFLQVLHGERLESGGRQGAHQPICTPHDGLIREGMCIVYVHEKCVHVGEHAW